jgi:hypothetical protein
MYPHHVVFSLPTRQIYRQVREAQTYFSLLKQREIKSSEDTIFQLMHDIFKNHADQILAFVESVELLFPEFRFQNRTRTSRESGWCTLCGRYYRKLYNTATLEDINDLSDLLKKQADLSGRRFDELENELSAFASFSHITTTKLQALTHITETLNKRSITVEAEAHRRSFQLSELIVLFADVSSFQAATHDLMQLEYAIQMLQHGFLTQTLLPFSQASAIIDDVTAHLSDFKYLHIVNSDPLSLYHDTRVTAYRLAETLHLLLQIKVSSFTAPLMMFRLAIFPLGIDDQHSTQVISQPVYIAINSVDKEYLTFQEKPTIDEQGTYYLHANEHQMRTKDDPSCILALFMDDLVNVKSLCKTVFQPYGAKPMAVSLDKDQFLFQNLPQVKVISANGDQMITSLDSDARVMQIQCNKRVITMAGRFHTSHCRSSDPTPPTRITAQVQNFHVLTAMVDDGLLQQMDQKVSLAESLGLNFSNPEFDIHDDPQLQEAFETLQQVALPLDDIINKSLSRQKIYKSAAAKLSHDLAEFGVNLRSDFQFPDLFSWIVSPFNIPTNLLLGLLAIVTAYLFYRVRALNTAFLLLQRPHTIEAQTLSLESQIELFIKNRQTTTTQKPFIMLPDYQPEISQEFHVLQMFIFVSLITICAYCIWRKIWQRRHSHETELILEISNKRHAVKIPLMTLPHPAELYAYSASEFLTHLSIQSQCFRAHLHMVWPSLRIKHKLLTHVLEIPQKVTIDIFTARRAQRILANHYEVLMFTRSKTSDCYQLLPLEGSTWLTIQNSHHASLSHDQRVRQTQSLLVASSPPPSYV